MSASAILLTFAPKKTLTNLTFKVSNGSVTPILAIPLNRPLSAWNRQSLKMLQYLLRLKTSHKKTSHPEYRLKSQSGLLFSDQLKPFESQIFQTDHDTTTSCTPAGWNIHWQQPTLQRSRHLQILLDRIQKTIHVHDGFLVRMVSLAFQVRRDDALIHRGDQRRLELVGVGFEFIITFPQSQGIQRGSHRIQQRR